MQLSNSQKQTEKQLLAICTEFAGEYLDPMHGSGSWATSYSNEFILASAQLLMLYKSAGAYMPEYELSNTFLRQGIKSCRGSDMTIARIKYLADTYLNKKIAELNKNK